VYGHGLAWVGPFVGVALLVAALGTAFYMSRLYFLVFSGDCRADEHVKHHIHESPVSMVFPLVVLAAGAILSGFVGVPPAIRELFGKHGESTLAVWLEPAVGAPLEIAHRTEWMVMGFATLTALAGIGLAYVFYGGGYRAPAHAFAQKFPGLVSLARDKFRIDELYGFLIIRPLQAFCRLVFQVVDRVLIDKILIGGWAFVADLAAACFASSRPATCSATWPCSPSGWRSWCGSRRGRHLPTKFASSSRATRWRPAWSIPKPPAAT
jgi:NADH-quinone oxidoreductase subunit L